MICGWSVTLAGGFIFAAIYTDDLSARTLSTLVALGYSKVKIVLGKFILTALVCAIAFAVAPLFFYAVHALFGCQASPSDLLTYYSYALSAFLTIVGFSQLAAICAYGIQRPTFAIVLYLLLSLGVIGGLISAALTTDAVQGIAPGINGFLLTSFANNASVSIIDASEAGAFAFLGCLIWYAVSIFASTFVFSKKEMEF
jgi:ABC-type transport system involved in multi-copper enzyme maturation permease subunit